MDLLEVVNNSKTLLQLPQTLRLTVSATQKAFSSVPGRHVLHKHKTWR